MLAWLGTDHRDVGRHDVILLAVTIVTSVVVLLLILAENLLDILYVVLKLVDLG